MTKISRRQALTMLGSTGMCLTLLPTMILASDETIICNWDNTFPPYSMERNGTMTGILVDCLNEVLGKRMGYPLAHHGFPWPEAQDMIRSGSADTLCTNPTDARKQFMIFSAEPLVESLPSIFCSAKNPRLAEIQKVTTLHELKGYRQVDYAGNGWARRTFPPYLRINWVKNMSEVFSMIAKGDADIFVGNGLAAMYAIKQAGLKKVIEAREFPVGTPSSFHLGIRRDFPEGQQLMKDFDRHLDKAQNDGTTRDIIMHYL